MITAVQQHRHRIRRVYIAFSAGGFFMQARSSLREVVDKAPWELQVATVVELPSGKMWAAPDGKKTKKWTRVE